VKKKIVQQLHYGTDVPSCEIMWWKIGLIWNWHCKVIWIMAYFDMHVMLIYACDSIVIWYCCMICSCEMLCGLTWVKSWTWARTWFACLFMCRCCLRWNVIDDVLELDSGRNWGFGTKFREELKSYQSRMSCRTFGIREQCTWRWSLCETYTGDV
jgi:hypothetical protein